MIRNAEPESCPRCARPTLVGPDDDTAALTVRADPNPLTPLAEATALAEGQATYALRRVAGRIQLTRRDPWAIAARSADSIHVIADHECDTSQVPAHQAPPPPLESRQETQGEFPF